MRTITDEELKLLGLHPGRGPKIKNQPVTVRHKDNLIKRFDSGEAAVFINHFSESQVVARTNIAMKMRNEIISKLIFPRILNA